MRYTPIKATLIDNNSGLVRGTSIASQAQPQVLSKAMPIREIKAYTEPPIEFVASLGYKDKPTNITYNTLYQMATKNSVVGAVINTRVNQVSTFTKPARFSDDNVGFKISLRDPKATPTEEQQEIILRLEKFIENCGYKKDNSRDDFDTFIRKLTRDSLTYDQATFEIVPDRKGLPAEFVVVDASTIRSATENFQYEQYMGDIKPKKNEEVAYVQVIDGMVQAWFTANELCFGVRNPRSSIYLQPYGFSELEQLITQITSHLYAEEYNSRFFSQGGTTKGIINLKSDPNGVMNEEQLSSFKRQWRAQISGMTGAWKTPVLQVPNGIEYINVSQSNREMEFEKWMNYLINIVCAVYQIDPSEVNFPNNGGVGGGSGSVFESNNESKIKNSKDKGLKPLLRFLESLINKNIISRFSDEFTFSFVGLDEKSEDEKVELTSKKVHNYMTVNEVRVENGLDKIENGDVLLDASWLNYHTQQAMMNQGGQQGGSEDEEQVEDNGIGEETEDDNTGNEEYPNEEDEEYSEENVAPEEKSEEESEEEEETAPQEETTEENKDNSIRKSITEDSTTLILSVVDY